MRTFECLMLSGYTASGLLEVNGEGLSSTGGGELSPLPEPWTAALVEHAAIRLAGQHGWSLCTSTRWGDVEDAENFDYAWVHTFQRETI